MLVRMTDTEAKWAERIREWRESGKTAEVFAEGKQFEGSTLRYWSSRLKTKPASQHEGSSVVPAGSEPKKRVAMARVVRGRLKRDSARVAAGSELAITVGSATIRVLEGFDAKLLREVVAALGGVG